jgi:tight adherence protein C
VDVSAFIIIVVGAVGAWALYSFLDTRDKEVRDRLERLGDLTKGPEKERVSVNEELEKPFSERVILPVLRIFSSVLQKRASGDMLSNLQKQLAMAGHPGNLRPQDFLFIQGAWFVIALGAAAYFSFKVMKATPQDAMVHLFAGAIVGYLVPRYYLQSRISKRQHLIQLQLPDLLDLLTVSVEAGLGFDAGIQKCTDKMEGPLSEECRTVLREVRVGKARKQALRDAADRIKVHDVDVFFSAIIQAEQLGVSLAKVLRVQSDGLRLKRRQRAEETAQKAPIKMMFPLVLFIFPTIFIVLMGPAILQALHILKTQYK